MKLYGVNAIPAEARVMKVFDMIVHTGSVSLGSRLGRSIDEQSRDVRRKFAEMAPNEANAIVSVQVATNVVLDTIGSGGNLFFTFCGNPAILEEE